MSQFDFGTMAAVAAIAFGVGVVGTLQYCDIALLKWKDYKHAVAACELNIPRNRFCDAEWQTFVKPLEPATQEKPISTK